MSTDWLLAVSNTTGTSLCSRIFFNTSNPLILGNMMSSTTRSKPSRPRIRSASTPSSAVNYPVTLRCQYDGRDLQERRVIIDQQDRFVQSDSLQPPDLTASTPPVTIYPTLYSEFRETQASLSPQPVSISARRLRRHSARQLYVLC